MHEEEPARPTEWQLTETQISRLVAFLPSLTGPVPPDFATAPVLPSAAFRGTEATK